MKKISWKSKEHEGIGFESGWLDDEAYLQLLSSLQSDAKIYDIEVKEDENAEWQRL